MFVNVGRFHFRPMGDEERRSVVESIERDVPPIARASAGFRGVYFARPSEDEVLVVWLWESAADWEAALPRFGPSLQAHIVPHLSQPPERVGGEAVVQVEP